METLCYRFPHVASMILKDLDDQSLMKSIEANRELDNFLSNDRIYWIRVLAHYNENFMQFKDPWRRSLHQVPAVKIKELAIAASNFFKHRPARINSQWSPLHIAANSESLESYKYISRKCGCIDHVRDDGVTAIHMAASAGQIEIVTFIIDNLQDQNQSAASCIIDDQPTFGDQVHKNPGNADGLTPLHLAALRGHFEICKFIMNLLTNKNPRDKYGWTPLHCVAKGGNIKIYKLLMENLADKNPGNNYGMTPLHTASHFGHLEIIKLIMHHLQNKNPENIDGYTPLHAAVKSGNLEVLKFHVNNLGVKILGDDNSYTLLHSAARYGNLTVCKLLLQHSKEKNSADRNGWTPLQYAANNGHFAICELLIEHFGDKHPNAWTLGHFAVKSGSSRLSKEIYKGLKNVSPKTLNGITPLQLIALHLCKSIQGGDSATI